jgi:hypothetical protein
MTLTEETMALPQSQETFEIFLESPHPGHLVVEEDRKPAAIKKRGHAVGASDHKKKIRLQTRHSENPWHPIAASALSKNRLGCWVVDGWHGALAIWICSYGDALFAL